MHVLRSALMVAALATLVVACGGTTPPATQGPDGGGDTPAPQATEGPIATQPGGNGGNIGGGSGEIHIEVRGPVEATNDVPFFANGSRFSGDVAGVQLNFTTELSDVIIGITGVQDTWVISYGSETILANAATCERTNWNIGATSASGSFECTQVYATTPDGTGLEGVTFRGSFTASQ